MSTNNINNQNHILETHLNKISNMINDKIIPRYLDEYFLKMYSFSNENLSGYLRNNSYQDKSVLTVGSSADQILNLINYNCSNITLIDINPFVKYYYELKKAAILGLTRNEYLNFFTNNNFFFKSLNPAFNYRTYHKISPYLSQDTKTFWNYIFSNYDPLITKKKLFMPNELSKYCLIKNNDYLLDDNFKSLRNKLEHSSIDFKIDDVMNRKQTYSQYDFIILSNVFDYIFNIAIKTESEIAEVLKTKYSSLLFELTNLLTDQGIMYFQYLWDNTNIENYYYYLFDVVFKNYPSISKINIPSSNQIPNQIDSVYIYKKTLSK